MSEDEEGQELVDIHVFLPKERFVRLKRLCTHKGDKSYHINNALEAYLRMKEVEAGAKAGQYNG